MPQQLTADQEALMEEVRKGDLLFHGDAAPRSRWGPNLTNTGMACAIAIP